MLARALVVMFTLLAGTAGATTVVDLTTAGAVGTIDGVTGFPLAGRYFLGRHPQRQSLFGSQVTALFGSQGTAPDCDGPCNSGSSGGPEEWWVGNHAVPVGNHAVPVVPEPDAMFLFAAGAVVVGINGRRRRPA